MKYLYSIILTVSIPFICLAFDSDEISLFDSKGTATAYIAEELTIYFWSGKPVAYLCKDSAGGFHVYGFNGKHLGWFVKGIIRDHQGKAVGATKDAIAYT
ncbi:MAG: 4-fold beta flower protein [Kiritimatiellales bacterium]